MFASARPGDARCDLARIAEEVIGGLRDNHRGNSKLLHGPRIVGGVDERHEGSDPKPKPGLKLENSPLLPQSLNGRRLSNGHAAIAAVRTVLEFEFCVWITAWLANPMEADPTSESAVKSASEITSGKRTSAIETTASISGESAPIESTSSTAVENWANNLRYADSAFALNSGVRPSDSRRTIPTLSSSASALFELVRKSPASAAISPRLTLRSPSHQSLNELSPRASPEGVPHRSRRLKYRADTLRLRPNLTRWMRFRPSAARRRPWPSPGPGPRG